MKDFFKRLAAFEPVQLRAVLTALVVVLGTVGLEFAPIADKIDTAWVALFAIIPIIQGLVTRPAVTPNAVVVEAVEDADVVVAGEANEAPTGDFVRYLH
jgi:hypothetical protein